MRGLGDGILTQCRSARARMAMPNELRPNWLAVLATSIAVLVSGTLLASPHGWPPALCLIPLSLAAWVFDSLPLTITLCIFATVWGFAGAGGSPWLPIDPVWAPQPIAMWLTAIV